MLHPHRFLIYTRGGPLDCCGNRNLGSNVGKNHEFIHWRNQLFSYFRSSSYNNSVALSYDSHFFRKPMETPSRDRLVCTWPTRITCFYRRIATPAPLTCAKRVMANLNTCLRVSWRVNWINHRQKNRGTAREYCSNLGMWRGCFW